MEELKQKTAELERLPDQPGDVPVTYADVRRAERALGYRSETPLAEGVQKFCRWYLEEKLAARLL